MIHGIRIGFTFFGYLLECAFTGHGQTIHIRELAVVGTVVIISRSTRATERNTEKVLLIKSQKQEGRNTYWVSTASAEAIYVDSITGLANKST